MEAPEVELALRRAEVSIEIACAVGGETDLRRVLDLVARRSRALVEAQTLLVLLRKGDRLRVAASAGRVGSEVDELTVPTDDEVFQRAMHKRVAQHLERGSPPSEAHVREHLGAETALVVPLLFRGRAVGTLLALDRESGGDFEEEDLRLLQAVAATAATAVATAQTVEAELLQQQIEAGERERERWARELHDETLQSLAAIRISLAAALQGGGPDRDAAIALAAEQTVDRLADQINELGRLINDLRPASLERLGLAGALGALAEESADRGGFEVETEIELDRDLTQDEERTVYRLAQEALNNVVRHSAAAHASVCAKLDDCEVQIAIRDDGSGFDVAAANGRGLIGMRERVALLGGSIDVRSRPAAGTEVLATLPVCH